MSLAWRSRALCRWKVIDCTATRAFDRESDGQPFGQLAMAGIAAHIVFHLQVSKIPLNLPGFQR
jgi:hypothetical protein